MTKHMGEFDPSSTFDQYFQAQAKKNGLPCGGLETLQKQINVLYTGKPMSRQVEELMCFIDNENFNSQMMEDLTSAFYAQNLETLKQVMDRKLGGKCDSTPEEEDMLINNRNVALSRQQLYEYVWKEEYYGETRTLDNHIKRIRQKLGYEDVIKTVFGIGYRLEAPEG